MGIRVEPDSHVPVYLQIVEHIRSAIAAGIYRSGESLPSLRMLATDLKVNPNTVQKAFDELCRQGLVKSHRGVGMLVAARGPRAARGRTEESTQEAFIQTIIAATNSGLSVDRIREIFETSLEQMPSTSGGRR